MAQRRDISSGLVLWGNALCQQLCLPTLNWEGQRDNYPFFRDPITPALFAQPNPCAFQSLLHFLFSILDPIEASDKFFGLWPLKAGDKKADSQFRSALFRWLGRLQKGEWTSAPNPKRVVPARHEAEAVAEANRMGPALFDMRMAPSHYVSPVGEDPTALVAKLACIVASVEEIRQRGAEDVGFVPISNTRPRGKKNKRDALRSSTAARRAESAGEQLDEALERASDDAFQLNNASQMASTVYANVLNDSAALEDQMTNAASAVESPPNTDALNQCIESMRTFNRGHQ